jgi:hypothetical protein
MSDGDPAASVVMPAVRYERRQAYIDLLIGARAS